MSRPGCQVWILDTLADQALHVHRHASDVEQAVTLSLMRMLVLNALWKRSQAVMSSQGYLGVRPVPARPVTRSQTPKLATKTRAAAHPAPAQGPVPAPKLRAPFHPGKLTVPQSPAFATRSRLRAQVYQTLL